MITKWHSTCKALNQAQDILSPQTHPALNQARKASSTSHPKQPSHFLFHFHNHKAKHFNKQAQPSVAATADQQTPHVATADQHTTQRQLRICRPLAWQLRSSRPSLISIWRSCRRENLNITTCLSIFG